MNLVRGLNIAVLSAIAATGLGFAAQPAYCWDGVGHQVITQIAYDHLQPGVKTQVDALIVAMNNDPDVTGLDASDKPYNFVTAGCWMDDIRSISREFNTWHYSDLPMDDDSLTPDDVAKFTDSNPNNNVHAIETFCLPTLKNPSAPLADRARALGFFLHLAGDIHQPLHSVGIDKGGNAWTIDPLPSADPTWHVTNLHSFWDNAYRYSGKGGIISIVQPALDKPRITAPGQDPIRAFATELETNYMPRAPDAVTDDNCADWALESKNIAQSFVYPALDGGHTLTPDYVQVAHDLACQRLVLAGLRIADVLNNIFGSSTAPAK